MPYRKIFTDLSGGHRSDLTALELGLDSKKIYWADAKNVEISATKGIARQGGNTLMTQSPDGAAIMGLCAVESKTSSASGVLYATALGNLYYYSFSNQTNYLKHSGMTQDTPCVFIKYLNGIIVSNGADDLLFFKQGAQNEVSACNAADANSRPIRSRAIASFKGRLWVGVEDRLYFSALGTYDDWTTPQDAGYIANFHSDAALITALRPYKEYLAIYKRTQTYLLGGDSPEDFVIMPFADKGAAGQNAVANASNKQYFLSDYVFSLEQSGILAQIALSSEVSQNIKPEFADIDKSRITEAFVLPYERKNQLWFFIPHSNRSFLNYVWIWDYYNQAWFKRVVPQAVCAAAVLDDNIITATSSGEILIENLGSTFNGETIDFYWKTPFLALGNENERKTIDEFYFLLNDDNDNNFDLSVYKNYDTLDCYDAENIFTYNEQNLLWAHENEEEQGRLADTKYIWGGVEAGENGQYWALPAETAVKAEISESCFSFQLCVSGENPEQNCGITGLEFKEITGD